ncbi:hypothetical protein GCM10010390_29830 [Streptomyces mordarskii]|uniref:Uncharacterized protein n=1 Tax=Streptomyces mordarskii TaxID=1226758 RepID=A0ABN1CSZ4_9ACTN
MDTAHTAVTRNRVPPTAFHWGFCTPRPHFTSPARTMRANRLQAWHSAAATRRTAGYQDGSIPLTAAHESAGSASPHAPLYGDQESAGSSSHTR